MPQATTPIKNRKACTRRPSTDNRRTRRGIGVPTRRGAPFRRARITPLPSPAKRPDDLVSVPAIRAVQGAGVERALLQVTKLVDHEERVQAVRLEMTVSDRAVLFAVQRAFGAVHVQRDTLRGLPAAHGFDPAAREIGQAKGIIKFAVQRQAAVGTDGHNME